MRLNLAVSSIFVEKPLRLSCRQNRNYFRAIGLNQKPLVFMNPLRRPGFEPGSGHIVVEVALGQVFSKCFGFPCQFAFN
jgi:hypothetical protein